VFSLFPMRKSRRELRNTGKKRPVTLTGAARRKRLRFAFPAPLTFNLLLLPLPFSR
jgi:hypothetical protein